MAKQPELYAAYSTIVKKMRNIDKNTVFIGSYYNQDVFTSQYWNKKRNIIYFHELKPGGSYDDIKTRYFYGIPAPCAVGDTVYYRTYKNNGSTDIGIQPHEVIGIKTIVQTKGADIPIEAFDKDVFTSRYEAERMG